MEKYSPCDLADLVKEQLEHDPLCYPALRVVNGMVKVYEEPDSTSPFVKVPPKTRLTVVETRPSRNSKSTMALVSGEFCQSNGAYVVYDGWVSLSSDNLILT